MSNITLRATCDRILAIAPPPVPEPAEMQVDKIIIPAAAMAAIKAKMAENPMQVLEIASAGPDCKVAKKGMKVIVNKNHYQGTIEYEGVHYACFSEVTAFAILEPAPAEGAAPPPAQAKLPDLTIAEVKAGLGIADAPKDDRHDLPAEAAKD